MSGCGIKAWALNRPSGFYHGFLNAWNAAWVSQGEREIDVLVGMAARAVFPDPNHGSFKAGLTPTATVPDDKRPGIIFRLKACDKQSRVAACRAEHSFNAASLPKSLRYLEKDIVTLRVRTSDIPVPAAKPCLRFENSCFVCAHTTHLRKT